MIRKMLCLLCALALVLSLAACGGTAGAALPVLELEQAEGETSGENSYVHPTPSTADYEDDLMGLLLFMEDSGAIVRDPNAASFDETERTIAVQGEAQSFVQMSFKEIGAVDGYRYQFTFNRSTVQAEFYEFDPENMDEKARLCVDSVQTKGFFELLGNQVPAVLHPSGKYLMIYSDASAEGDKAKEGNKAQKDWVQERFLAFQA